MALVLVKRVVCYVGREKMMSVSRNDRDPTLLTTIRWIRERESCANAFMGCSILLISFSGGFNFWVKLPTAGWWRQRLMVSCTHKQSPYLATAAAAAVSIIFVTIVLLLCPKLILIVFRKLAQVCLSVGADLVHWSLHRNWISLLCFSRIDFHWQWWLRRYRRKHIGPHFWPADC